MAAQIFFFWGGGVSKNFDNYCEPFFSVDQFDFPSSPKILWGPYFVKHFLHRRQNFHKNRPTKAFLGTFWKILTKKIAKAPLEKFKGCSSKHGCHKIIAKGDPLEKFGNQNWGGGGVDPKFFSDQKK